MNYELKLNDKGPEQGEGADEGILSSDVRNVVRPAVTDLRGAIMRRTQDLRQARKYLGNLFSAL